MYRQGSLTEEKAQYSWPPCTTNFRSAPLYFEITTYLFYKTSYLREEVNCTEPFPSVSVLCMYRQGSLTEGEGSVLVDVLVLTILDLVLYILKLLLTFFTKQATLMRRSTVLSISLQLVFPVCIGREVLLKGKAQYGWPACTNYFRSAPLYIEIIIYLFTKQATLVRRSTVLSLPFS